MGDKSPRSREKKKKKADKKHIVSISSPMATAVSEKKPNNTGK